MFADLTVIVFKFLFPEKAFAPIFAIFLPIVTFFNFLQFLIAFFPIDVTLYFLPFFVTMSGIFTVLTFCF